MKPQLGSRTGGVVDGIIALFADDEPGDFTDVIVLDGPPVGEDIPDDTISVAPGDPSNPGVVVNRRGAPGLGRQAYLEATEVTMILSCYAGDTDMKTRRDRAVTLFNAIKRRVDANKVVAGKWDNLYLGEQEAWHPVQSDEGCTVAVGFTIVAESVV